MSGGFRIVSDTLVCIGVSEHVFVVDYLCQNDDEMNTSSSAVTERPRDASCPSVVSFNSTIR